MNTEISGFFRSLRWREVPHYITGFLTLFGSRQAVLKPCAGLLVNSGAWQGLLKCVVPAGVTLVGTHSLSGATTEVAPVNGSKNPAAGTINTPFSWFFSTQGAQRAKSFTVSALPAGLTYTYGSPVSSITGRPTVAGSFNITIKGWENSNRTGASTPVYTLKLNVAAPPPVITEVSTGGVFGAGAAVNLSVTATGAGLTYQWRRDGVAIAGATSSQYLIPAFASDLAGTYTVVVTGSGGAVTSAPIILQFLAPPVITSLSPGGAFPAGTKVDLEVAATGTGLTYQWKKEGVDLPAATAATYSIAALTAESAGTYAVVVSSGTAAVTSAPIVLTLKPAFDIWRERFWSNSADLNDPAISGPLGDPDRDGLENVLEYVLELNPSAIDPDSIGDLIPDPADPAFLLMSVPLDPLATDVIVQWQRSVDLGGDRWVIVPENDPEYQVSRLPDAVSIRFPKALGAGFFRLRATLN
jgi:hypothetical protein